MKTEAGKIILLKEDVVQYGVQKKMNCNCIKYKVNKYEFE